MSENTVVLAVGKKGCGKTTWSRRYSDRCRRLIVADAEETWAVGPKDQLVTKAGDLFDFLADGQFAEHPDRPFRVVYRDTWRPSDKAMGEVAFGAAFATRNCTLDADELALFTKNRTITPHAEKFLSVGRSRRVNLIATTRAPQELNGRFFDAADVRALFFMEPGPGWMRVKEWFGSEIAEHVKTLTIGQFRLFGNENALDLFGREGLDFSAARRNPRSRSHNSPRR